MAEAARLGEVARQLKRRPEDYLDILGPLPKVRSDVTPDASLRSVGFQFAAATAVIGDLFSEGIGTTARRS